MKKKIKNTFVTIISLLIVLPVAAFLIVVISFFFDSPSQTIGQIDIDEQNKIEIIYTMGNATMSNYTEVKRTKRTSCLTKKEYVLKSYTTLYNSLEGYSLDGDSLTLILGDTINHRLMKIDTCIININDIHYEL